MVLPQVTDVRYSSAKHYIASCSCDGSVILRDDSQRAIGHGSTQTDLTLQEAGAEDITGIAISDDLGLLATGSRDGVLKIWSFDNAYPLAEMEDHAGEVTQVRHQGRSLLGGGAGHEAADLTPAEDCARAGTPADDLMQPPGPCPYVIAAQLSYLTLECSSL